MKKVLRLLLVTDSFFSSGLFSPTFLDFQFCTMPVCDLICLLLHLLTLTAALQHTVIPGSLFHPCFAHPIGKSLGIGGAAEAAAGIVTVSLPLLPGSLHGDELVSSLV